MFFCVVTLFGLWKKMGGNSFQAEQQGKPWRCAHLEASGKAGLGWKGPQARSLPGALRGQDSEVSTARAAGADWVMTWERGAQEAPPFGCSDLVSRVQLDASSCCIGFFQLNQLCTCAYRQSSRGAVWVLRAEGSGN